METTKKRRIPKKYRDNFIFDFTWIFNEYNFAQVRLGEYLYFIDVYGKCLGKLKCEELSIYNGGIKINGKWGILFESKLLIPPIYDEISNSFDNYFEVKINGKCGLIDSQNNFIIKPKYDLLEFNTQLNLFFAKLNKKYGVIDINENVIIPFDYDEFNIGEHFPKKTNKLIATKNGKTGIINLKNKIIMPFEYKQLEYVTNNTFIVKKSDNKYIIINNKNEQICRKVFEDLQHVYTRQRAIFAAKYQGLYGFIDKYGNTKIDFQYTDIGMALDGYCEVSKNNSENDDYYGCINSKGKLVLPFKYEKNSTVSINKNRFKAGKKGFEGIINRNNKIIADFIFDYIAVVPTRENNFFPATINKKAGFINQDGEPLIIDKTSLKNAKEIFIDLSTLNQKEQLKYILDGRDLQI